MGAAWDVTAFALRAAGSKKQQDINYVISGTLLLLLAPLCKSTASALTIRCRVTQQIPAAAREPDI